ncbi:Oxidoreductase htatip2 [Coemansia sp. RSA 552]|nr:Oxidoreductase htatip2 [Coemansia sp. RSA 552]
MATTVKIVVSDKLVLGSGFRKAAEEFKAQCPGKSALVLGATGEVGREVVKHLMASDAFDKVTVFARRPIEFTGAHAEKLVQKPVDFEDTEQLQRDFAGHTHAFTCLGTTRSKSGKDGFYKVDHDYILNAAKACKEANVEHYSLCSSGGADKDSSFFYMKTKGEVDSEVQQMGFPRVSIFRPGMLICDREDSRVVEGMGRMMAPLLNFIAPNRWVIETSTVGWAMVNNAFQKTAETPTAEIIDNKQMLDAFQKDK